MSRPLVTAADVARGGAAWAPPEGALLTPAARDALRRRAGPGAGPDAAEARAAAPRRLVIANWKSYKTQAEAREFARALLGRPELRRARATAVVCPPFTALAALGAALGERVELGAQDVSAAGEGAHTGEVAARHLVDVGCRWALVGHSERRAAGEDDARCRAKVRAALAGGLRPVLCVGETKAERDAGRTDAVVQEQLARALEGLGAAEVAPVVVAYEPRWAIGAGVTPAPEAIVAALAGARAGLARAFGAELAARASVLYGGSVTEQNAAALLALDGCSGALVGGASLDPARFAAILVAA